MRQLYEKNSANYPRLKTDKFFVDYGNIYRLNGYIKRLADFIEDCDIGLESKIRSIHYDILNILEIVDKSLPDYNILCDLEDLFNIDNLL